LFGYLIAMKILVNSVNNSNFKGRNDR
jgi:hypothetical protein